MRYKIWQVYDWDFENNCLMYVEPTDCSNHMFVSPEGRICSIVVDEHHQILGIHEVDKKYFEIEVVD